MALDLHIENTSTGAKMPIVDQYLYAERFCFGGIGVYPFWHDFGLHVDVRIDRDGARWWRDKNGKYKGINGNALLVWMRKDGYIR